MRFRMLVLSIVLLLPAVASAQDFGVMESAETIDRGNFKFRVNPMLFFGNDVADESQGVTFMGGYGFTDKFDVEAGAALYDGVHIVGGNAEFWLMKRQPFDFSIIPGLARQVEQKRPPMRTAAPEALEASAAALAARSPAPRH